MNALHRYSELSPYTNRADEKCVPRPTTSSAGLWGCGSIHVKSKITLWLDWRSSCMLTWKGTAFCTLFDKTYNTLQFTPVPLLRFYSSFLELLYQQFAELTCSSVGKSSMDISSSFSVKNVSESCHSRHKYPSLYTKSTSRDGLSLETKSFITSFKYHPWCVILSRPNKMEASILTTLFRIPDNFRACLLEIEFLCFLCFYVYRCQIWSAPYSASVR